MLTLTKLQEIRYNKIKESISYSDLTGRASADLNSGAVADKFEFIADQLELDKNSLNSRTEIIPHS